MSIHLKYYVKVLPLQENMPLHPLTSRDLLFFRSNFNFWNKNFMQRHNWMWLLKTVKYVSGFLFLFFFFFFFFFCSTQTHFAWNDCIDFFPFILAYNGVLIEVKSNIVTYNPSWNKQVKRKGHQYITGFEEINVLLYLL